jgi:hypothetical protein
VDRDSFALNIKIDLMPGRMIHLENNIKMDITHTVLEIIVKIILGTWRWSFKSGEQYY